MTQARQKGVVLQQQQNLHQNMISLAQMLTKSKLRKAQVTQILKKD